MPACAGGDRSIGPPPWASLPSSSAPVFRGRRDDQDNDIAAEPIVAWHAPSRSSPAPSARRCAALGLDRSVRPSKLPTGPLMPHTRWTKAQIQLSQKSLTQDF